MSTENLMTAPVYIYEIIQETELIVQNKKAIDTSTAIIWHITPLQTDHFTAVSIEVKQQEVKKIASSYQSMVSFIQQLNKITDKIDLQLGQYQNITQVINSHEIWDKWEFAKDALLSNAPNPNDLKAMINGGDNDYKDATLLIKNTPLYKIFFPPIIGEKQAIFKIRPLNVFGDLPSQLYVGQKVDYEVFEEVTFANEHELKFNHQGKIMPDKASAFKEPYEKNYQELLGKQFDYKWDYLASYKFDKPKNTLLQCEAVITEQTCPALWHKNKFTITLKSNDQKSIL